MMNYLSCFMMCMQMKMKELLTNEEGDVNIVSIVVLIGVAVLLAIVFKDAIGELIQNLLDTIGEKATNTVTQEY